METDSVVLSDVNKTGATSETSDIITKHLNYITYKMNTIETVLNQIAKNLSKQKKPPTNMNIIKWKTFASVLDRLFILIQVALICVSVSLLLPRN